MPRRYLTLLAACGLALALALPLIASADSPPKIPHLVQGREECSSCHKVGGPGVRVVGGTGMPSDHAGRENRFCAGCHLPAAPQETTASAQPVSAPPAATAVPTVVAAAVVTPTATLMPTVAARAVAGRAQAPPATVTSASAAALPAAGEPLEDAAFVASFFIAGLLLLAAAAAVHRTLARS